MKKRRLHPSSVGIASISTYWGTVKQNLAEAAELCRAMAPEHLDPAAAPAPSAPADLASCSEAALAGLAADFEAACADGAKALEQWERVEKGLQAALDATLMVISLRSEPETKKRRRAAAVASAAATAASAGGSRSSTPATAVAASVAGGAADVIAVGTKVAMRLPHNRGADEEWIRCEVTRVLQDGARYEVRDPEPDENGNQGRTYRASSNDLRRVPDPSDPPRSFAPGATVLAQYPETTTFYRAEMVSQRGTRCRLVFEGEEEAGKITEVDARLVLLP